MRVKPLTYAVMALTVAFLAGDCDSGRSAVNDTVTVAVYPGQLENRVLCHRHDNGPARSARLSVLRSQGGVTALIVPLDGHRVLDASVCVSSRTEEPDGCGNWVSASPGAGNVIRIIVPEEAYDYHVCAMTAYVHLRIRLAHDGPCRS